MIFLSVLLFLDYKSWERSGEGIFFKDKTQLEKDLRSIQKIKAQMELSELKKVVKDRH